ncbi:NAD(P)-dependent oxidoreductase [Faecalibacter bovis]|uniref:NAD(P)H-binding protein n=1 Tax=Faecalibacter bovis TaxID=2898187 RepID=A0ABX7XBP4_9FLAO|nr:NAD(P)H-binding protein [Faecalibacter bovis]QTV05305.1 NAD(P)H-binding protein [Faecalibacter bovis]
MRVALIGATGFVGSAILKELTDRNHSIKAISRSINTESESNNVVPIQIDVNDTDALAADLKGADVVISAFNPGWTNPNIYEEFLTGAKNIQEAVKKADVKRFIVIGGAGSLLLDEELRVIDTPQFPEEIKPGAQAAAEYLEFLKNENQIDWEFFSPAIEMHQGTSGVRTGKYRLGLDNPVVGKDGRSVLSVEDVAVVIADEVEKQNFTKRRFTAGY